LENGEARNIGGLAGFGEGGKAGKAGKTGAGHPFKAHTQLAWDKKEPG